MIWCNYTNILRFLPYNYTFWRFKTTDHIVKYWNRDWQLFCKIIQFVDMLQCNNTQYCCWNKWWNCYLHNVISYFDRLINKQTTIITVICIRCCHNYNLIVHITSQVVFKTTKYISPFSSPSGGSCLCLD